MKKAAFFMSIALTILLTSCGVDRSNIDNPPSTPGEPPIPTPPDDADFVVSLSASQTEGQVPLRVVFTATASEEAIYAWNITDRQWYAASRHVDVETNVFIHTFTESGKYTVTVSARSTAGEIANTSAIIDVTDDGAIGTTDIRATTGTTAAQLRAPRRVRARN